MRHFFVYVLFSPESHRIYIGQTGDLNKRLRAHNSGYSRATKPYRPWKIVYYELVRSRSQAVVRERYLKSSAGRKFLKTVF